ncbi:MAG: sugar phosphate nucleotidyltransferase [Candidatus Bathyarchaeota archaeon]|nr:sugar phosphate nucleotidyltransferase [Candidatus Bathyarchaeota archaeon]
MALAAGRGVRLKPLTLTRSKHMLPIGGAPLLEWMLRRLGDAGADEVLVVTHYMEEEIRGRFGDGSDLGLKLRYAKQERVLGTADAFRLAKGFAGGEDFIGVYGDLYVAPGAVEAVVEAHREGEATMAVVPVDAPSRYGVVELEGDMVTDIVEKPAPGAEPSRFANAGIYLFTPEVFRWIGETGPSKRREYEITDSLRMMIEAGAPVRAVELPADAWLDVGLPWNLLDANERALTSMEPSVEGDVEEGARIIGPARVCRGARVRSGAYIEGPVTIGEGSDIGPNCYIRPATSIGANVRVGNACEVKNSIIMDGTHVAHLSYVGDSVIGEGCNLGAGTITANIRFDEASIRVNVENRWVDSERRKLGTIIGDGAQTGIGVSIMPGVKIGPGAWIGPGLTVYDDVSEGTFISTPRAELKTGRSR